MATSKRPTGSVLAEASGPLAILTARLALDTAFAAKFFAAARRKDQSTLRRLATAAGARPTKVEVIARPVGIVVRICIRIDGVIICIEIIIVIR